jgi:glycosyltransferase involved in cell wall biosynthesis
VHCLDADIDGLKLILSGRTREIGDSVVTYHSIAELGWHSMRPWLSGGDLLYLNGFFGPVFSLKAAAVRRYGATGAKAPLLVAPRGELFPETLALKARKKRLGIAGIGLLGLYRDAAWHASTGQEVAAITEIARRLGQRTPLVHTACDIVSAAAPTPVTPPADHPRLIFFSRISPKKNLDFALRALAQVERPLSLDIVGPIEDEAHWRACTALIAAAPQHHITYKGTITPEEVPATLAAYDLFLLPTKSENFGHAIQEALAAGLPALISDQTPWRGLEKKGAGWDLPLDEKAFAAALRTFAMRSDDERQAMRTAARQASDTFASADAIENHRRMFRAILNGRGSAAAGPTA